ncbi:MAG: hypothetical protein NTX82_03940 [Candidatus Parcubacteria bacterium]|nr:hypothetical protein [Candidatus Parcubacteria bacterium]
MKKVTILIFCLAWVIVLVGCSDNKVNQPLSVNQQPTDKIEQVANDQTDGELITGSDYINKLEKIGDYYILQAEKIQDSNIYLLAQNYKIEQVDAWFGAPTGITQTGTFYFYQGDINQFDADKVIKIGDINFTGRKTYFSLNQLKNSKYQDENFVIIEQYEMNNFSKFYFWLVKPASIAPVKFDGANSVLSGWSFDSIKFKDTDITCYGYWGGQPFDYKETYKDMYWDGSNFELMMRWTIMNDDQNKYSFYTGEDKEKPTWEFIWQFDSQLIDYYVTPNKKNIVTIGTVPGGWYMSVHNVKTGMEYKIYAEPESVFEINKDKSTDNLILYSAQGVEVPPIDFQYNIETRENTQLSKPYDDSLKYRY